MRGRLVAGISAGLLAVSALAACGGDEGGDDTTSSSASTAAAQPAALVVDPALRDALGSVLPLSPIDAVETGRRFDATWLAESESIFSAYWAGTGEYRGTKIFAVALRLKPENDDSESVERGLSRDWPSRAIAGTRVFSNPVEIDRTVYNQFIWYASPNLVIVQGVDGEVLLELVESIIARAG